MVEFINASTYQETREMIELYAKDKTRILYLYFYGKKNDAGVSWCSDCVRAEPSINIAFQKDVVQTARVIIIDVGDRKAWFDSNNPYRKDRNIHLEDIPTLIRWNSYERLQYPYIANPDCLELFFEEAKLIEN